jgi:hypothetical protein
MSEQYSETQRFRNPIIFIILIALLGLGIWGIIQQIFMGTPFGTKPAPDALLIIFAMIPILFLLFFIFMKQKTLIGTEGIEIVISPFGNRRIAWKSIEKAYIRTYKPLLEYGGWGIRYGFGKTGMAYSVGGGDKGLQLELKNGQKILIGTNNAEAMEKFIKDNNLI